MSWPVGTIVVCVDASPGLHDRQIIGMPLVVNGHYTVREFLPSVAFWPGDGPGVKLQENVRVNGIHFDSEWSTKRFRLAESTHSESARSHAIRTAGVE